MKVSLTMEKRSEDTKSKLSIVIPAYNEVATIEEIVKMVNNVSLNMEKEIIIVDDGSSDGTREIVERLEGDNIKKLFHDKNHGKGAAIRTALKHVTGDMVIIQDADLEYHPDEYSQLIRPILEKKADVVFGSRFIGTHRCFLFTHYVGNKVLNLIANILYNTTLTDLMTCYKAFTIGAIKNISIKANRFGFEAEISGMVFRKNLRVYEVPISYSGRSYLEGKKIKWKDFFPIMCWLLYTKFRPLSKEVIQDSLDKLSHIRNYNSYIFDKCRPYLGKRVLEIGAGIGNITRFLIQKRELVVAVEKDYEKLSCLSQNIPDSSIFRAYHYDVENESFQELKRFKFDSAICINVLEHISDDKKVLRIIHMILEKEGSLILLIPTYKWLFTEFDKSAGHYRRYDKKDIERLLQECGFCIERIEHFNFLGVFPWWFNFKILKMRGFSSIQLFIFNHLVWLVKLLDHIFKNIGISLLVVARKK